jgi:hypothetical protein
LEGGGEREGEAFSMELTTVIGEREGGVREQREAVGTGGETAALAVPRFRQAACGLHEWVVAVCPVGSGHFNHVGWYCRHGLGPIRCTTFF